MFEIVQLFFLQPTASASWTSGGRPMIFQPESSILTRNQEKKEPFLGLTDRFISPELCHILISSTQDAAVGGSVLEEEGGAVANVDQGECSSSTFNVEFSAWGI